ncbi:MAG: S8 family serine peptidase, partial [Acidimicrobiales bacterium]
SCYGTDAQVSYVDVDGGPGVSGAGSGEAALDIEQIIGLAPQAHVTVYQSTSSADALYDDYLTAISSDSARVISTSWGICEGLATGTPGLTGESTVLSGLMHAENTLFEEAAAQGQSVVAASGDAGSEGCDPYESAYPGFGSELFVQDPSSPWPYRLENP